MRCGMLVMFSQLLLHDISVLTLLSSAMSSLPACAPVARMACLIVVALQIEDVGVVTQSGVLPLLEEAQRKFPNVQQIQQFVPALLLKYSIGK
jgi:hypothetical protein